MKPKPYDLMDYSDVSSKRAVRPNLGSNRMAHGGQGLP